MTEKLIYMNLSISISNRVSYTEKLLFTKHLDTMVKAGIPIDEALETIYEQTKSPYFKQVLKSLMNDTANGQSLAKSFRKFPKVFDQFFISMISVGEESGRLEENLDFLSKQLAKDNSLRKKVRGALLYPAIVLSATLVMGTFIAFFVLPRLVEFFESFDIELPLPTKILLFVANAFKDYGIYIIATIITFSFLFRFLVTKTRLKKTWHRMIIKIPIFGNLIMYSQIARFARNFGTLIKSGVPISKSLDITADTLSNIKFKADLEEIGRELTKGKSVGNMMKKNNYSEYPPIVSRMIMVGEKTGKLEETLLYLSEYYEDEVDDISKNLSTILEPVLLLVIGLVVGFVAISIVSPIYELTGSIRK